MISPEEEHRYFHLPWRFDEVGEDVLNKYCAFGEVLIHLFGPPDAECDPNSGLQLHQQLMHQLDPAHTETILALAGLSPNRLAVKRLSDPGECIEFGIMREFLDNGLDLSHSLSVTVGRVGGHARLIGWHYIDGAAEFLRMAIMAHHGAIETYAKLQARPLA